MGAKEPPDRRKKSVQWIELGTPAGAAAAPPLRVQLPGGASIEITLRRAVAGGGGAAARTRPGRRRRVLSFAGSLRVFVPLEPCDMRAGLNTLQGLVTEKLCEDSRGGALFVFSTRRHNRVKIFYWDGTGPWLLTKRLEAEPFSWPRPAEAEKVKMQLAPEAFTLLTDGIDFHGAEPRGWYKRG